MKRVKETKADVIDILEVDRIYLEKEKAEQKVNRMKEKNKSMSETMKTQCMWHLKECVDLLEMCKKFFSDIRGQWAYTSLRDRDIRDLSQEITRNNSYGISSCKTLNYITTYFRQFVLFFSLF